MSASSASPTTPVTASRSLTISAVVGVYNTDRYISETIQAILAQTRPADEIIVVDDGSTDATARQLEQFGSAIHVIRQANGGCPAAFNRAIAAATGDYIAICGADDLWKPRKLERQAASLVEHPEIDLAFAGSWSFGFAEAPWPDPPGVGILDTHELLRVLYRENIICASSVICRRSLFGRLGPLIEQVNGERFACDDYDFWLRALANGAVAYYEPGIYALYRRHANNATNNQAWLCRSRTETHRIHAHSIDDSRLVDQTLASDLRLQARAEVTDGEMRTARASFIASLHHERDLRALAFAFILSFPESWSRQLMARWVRIRPALRRLARRDRSSQQAAPSQSTLASLKPDPAGAAVPERELRLPAATHADR